MEILINSPELAHNVGDRVVANSRMSLGIVRIRFILSTYHSIKWSRVVEKLDRSAPLSGGKVKTNEKQKLLSISFIVKFSDKMG